MANVRIRSVSIRAYRSFREPARVEFPDRGLCLVRCRNLDTGGSSRGGKSALLTALAQVLDFSPFPATETQNWDTAEPQQVVLELESDSGGPATITWGHQPSIVVGGVRSTGAKAIQDARRLYLGLDTALLAALTYSEQVLKASPWQARGFLAKNNGEKQEFLASLLSPLEFVERALEVSQGRIRDLEPAIAAGNALLEREGQGVASFASWQPEPLADLDQLTAEVSGKRAALEEGKVQVAKLVAELEMAQAQVAAWQAEVKERHAPEIAAFRDAVQAATAAAAQKLERPPVGTSPERERLAELVQVAEARLGEFRAAEVARAAAHSAAFRDQDVQVAQLRGLEGRAAKLRLEVKNLEFDADRLGSDTCPTCDRTWDAAGAKLLDVRRRIALAADELSGCDAQLAKLPRLLQEQRSRVAFAPDPNVAVLEQYLATFREQLSAEVMRLTGEANAATREEASRRAVALLTAQLDLGAAEQRRDREVQEVWSQEHGQLIVPLQLATQEAVNRRLSLEAAAHQAHQALVLAEGQNATRAASNRQMAALKAQAERALEAAAQQAASTEVAWVTERDFARCLGKEGFLGAIFDEVLAEIEAEANLLLGKVANTASVAIQFRSEVESKKRGAHREIRTSVTVDGHQAPIRSACSGGQQSAIALAVDLAVRQVVRRRTGAGPGWVCYDESFDGLDLISKEACLGILREVAQRDLVLVVDHSTELKAAFETAVDLEYRGGETRVVGVGPA